MKVKDFAKKVYKSSLPFGVIIQQGMKKVEYIEDIKNLETGSKYLNEILNGFMLKETEIILYIKC